MENVNMEFMSRGEASLALPAAMGGLLSTGVPVQVPLLCHYCSHLPRLVLLVLDKTQLLCYRQAAFVMFFSLVSLKLTCVAR